ncbi:40S small subunit processome assembly factor 1-like [Antedon mediterranea]|uniref:40S small subunit processome assembly factor 1-like n=1 Tax=Antedon mediterranea TaxID=105859 RepID=UPI003AF8969D
MTSEKDTSLFDEHISNLILKRLNAYGDSLLEDNSSRVNKMIRKKNAVEMDKRNGSKKRKKKRSTTMTTNDLLKEKHKFTDFDKEIKMFKESEDFKKKKKRKKKVKTQKEVEVIVFNDPSKRKRTQDEDTVAMNSNTAIMSLKKAKIDVHQFGLSGFDYEDKEKMELQRAIRLGAQAPKKEYMNYKQLIETRKKERETETSQKEINRKLGIKVKKKPEKIVLKNKGFWVDPTQQRGVYIDGQVGKFTRGMQIVSKKDLKIKSSKSKMHKNSHIKL